MAVSVAGLQACACHCSWYSSCKRRSKATFSQLFSTLLCQMHSHDRVDLVVVSCIELHFDLDIELEIIERARAPLPSVVRRHHMHKRVDVVLVV